MPVKTKFTELKKIFKKLHSPDGCIWDKQQTYQTLVPYLKEEVEEFISSVEKMDFNHMKEELGDILLHVMFNSELASKDGQFNVEDVMEGLIKKMKRRHPHVFGKARVRSVDQIVANWNKIKALEKSGK